MEATLENCPAKYVEIVSQEVNRFEEIDGPFQNQLDSALSWLLNFREGEEKNTYEQLISFKLPAHYDCSCMLQLYYQHFIITFGRLNIFGFF